MAVQIKTEGFKQLQKSLKKAGATFPKDLKQTNFEVADFLKGEASGKARSLGGVFRKSAPSIRATKTAGYVAIRLGSKRHPYALGAEFGAKKYKQFQPWRGPMSDSFSFGYFLGPSIRDNKQQVIIKWTQGVQDIIDRAFGAGE
jgi:hypothetical protein